MLLPIFIGGLSINNYWRGKCECPNELITPGFLTNQQAAIDTENSVIVDKYTVCVIKKKY